MSLLLGIIAGLIGGASDIWSSSQQQDLAEGMSQEASLLRKYGMEGMEKVLAQRQIAYDEIWNRIYGGGTYSDLDDKRQTERMDYRMRRGLTRDEHRSGQPIKIYENPDLEGERQAKYIKVWKEQDKTRHSRYTDEG